MAHYRAVARHFARVGVARTPEQKAAMQGVAQFLIWYLRAEGYDEDYVGDVVYDVNGRKSFTRLMRHVITGVGFKGLPYTQRLREDRAMQFIRSVYNLPYEKWLSVGHYERKRA